MNRPIEDLLRQAYQAKVEPITEDRLGQLSDARAERFAAELANDTLETDGITRLDTGALPVLARRRAHSRWFAPVLAAAAVLIVAAGAVAIATSHAQRNERPAPPASHVSVPAPSSTPSVSPKPSGSTSTSSTSGGTPVHYLGRGKTGGRADVPWTAVGSGWRLLQPIENGTGNGPSLYLYDPAQGRYLITDELPAHATLAAWSPDGLRAMLQTFGDDDDKFQQLDLHSGQLLAGFSQHPGGFVSYTQPHGLAVMVWGQVQGTERLLRYSPDGVMQLAYPAVIDGVGSLQARAFYTPDGTQLLDSAGNYSVLLSNDGTLVRKYPLPKQNIHDCQPVRWWTAGVFLESCTQNSQASSWISLYLQPVSGAAPSVLVNRNSAIGMGYSYAWPLSNGDVLLSITSGCGRAGYDILHPDGRIVPLTLPAGVPAPGTITGLSGDLATFRVTHGCGGRPQNVRLLDYDMLTGQTSTLNANGGGVLLSYPGDN